MGEINTEDLWFDREYTVLPSPQLHPESEILQNVASSENGNKNFDNFAGRLETFTHWPVQISQKSWELANAGLHYSGMHDLVKCHLCGIQIDKWNKDDLPILEHAKSSNCPFVKQHKNNVGLKKFFHPRIDDTTDIPNNPMLCKLCYENPIQIVFFPCAHIVCLPCNTQLNKCPFCNVVRDFVNISNNIFS